MRVKSSSGTAAERSSLYVNGMLDVTSGEPSTEIEPYTSDVVIGNLIGGGVPFSGLIDEVAIWTRAQVFARSIATNSVDSTCNASATNDT